MTVIMYGLKIDCTAHTKNSEISHMSTEIKVLVENVEDKTRVVNIWVCLLKTISLFLSMVTKS